jgi:hypothetical protein
LKLLHRVSAWWYQKYKSLNSFIPIIFISHSTMRQTLRNRPSSFEQTSCSLRVSRDRYQR